MNLAFIITFISFVSFAQITKITTQPNWLDKECMDCMVYACQNELLDSGDEGCELMFINDIKNKAIYFIDNGVAKEVKLSQRDIVVRDYFFIFKDNTYTIYLSSLDIDENIKRGGEVYVYKNKKLIYGKKNLMLTFGD